MFPDQIAPGAPDIRQAVATLYGVWTFVFVMSFGAALRLRWRAFRIAPFVALLAALFTPVFSAIATGQTVSISQPSDAIDYLILAFYPAVAFVLTAFAAVTLGLISRILARALQPAPRA